MSILSYAQNFEDIVFWRALQSIGVGNYVDIGAQGPDVDSVSKLFHERGWRGVHVEPIPVYAAQMREARPRDLVVEAVISNVSGSIDFFEFPDTGLSTARSDIADRHLEQGFDRKKLTVSTILLDELFALAAFDTIHWMKIDVEGHEHEVLEGWASPVRPWILAIESTYPNRRDDVSGEWEDLVLGKGYGLIYRDGLNRFYLHDSHAQLAEHFNFPPNIFDDVRVTPAHWLNQGVMEQDRIALFRQFSDTAQETALRLDRAYAARLDDQQNRAQSAETRCHDLSSELAKVKSGKQAAEAEWQARIIMAEQTVAHAQEEAEQAGERASNAERELVGLLRASGEREAALLARLHEEMERNEKARAAGVVLGNQLRDYTVEVSALRSENDRLSDVIEEAEKRHVEQMGETTARIEATRRDATLREAEQTTALREARLDATRAWDQSATTLRSVETIQADAAHAREQAERDWHAQLDNATAECRMLVERLRQTEKLAAESVAAERARGLRQVERAEERASVAERHLDVVLRSVSWRWTSPIRRITRWLGPTASEGNLKTE